MPKIILVSLAVTLLISTGIGFVLADILGFWQGFVGSLIAQFLSSYFLATKNSKKALVDKEAANELINLQTVPIACPCGKNIFTAPVFFNTDNSFLCDKCGSRFKVELSQDTVLLTEPLNIQNVFNQLKERELPDNKV